ncbi:hypothetical protein J5N97_014827 [Dioscorea zingiberensis]|uniref:Symplekin n=1 Tax=Dioscorea zingiberensis TaxID=325984 RepID=A0A9D5HK51_9LILI|nr:hypothetical protein J5N97_014827 [Dioscorea zingiberensis]
MAASWYETAATLFSSARSSPDIPSKMEQLRQLKELLLHRDPSLVPEFASRIAELQSDRAAPARRFLAEMIGETAAKHIEVLPEMVPTLISFLKDDTPAVVRQAIKTGAFLFQYVLVKVAIKGLYSGELDEVLKECWAWMLNFKNAVLPIVTQAGSDGIKLLAIKFVEAMILLYTPDPNGSVDPPHEAVDDLEFNISWLRGGHPALSVGDLAMEASQSLGLLLDLLRFPQVKSLSNSIIIVLVSSLSAIAKKRPSFYGRILPVLLSLDPASSVIKGGQVPGAYHALKNAFVACLNCTHASAVPWRVRLLEALKAMNAGELVEQASVNKISGSMAAVSEDSGSTKDEKVTLQACDEAEMDIGRKRHLTEHTSDVSQDDNIPGKRVKLTSPLVQDTKRESVDALSGSMPNNPSLIGSTTSTSDGDSKPVQQLVGMFAALVAQGDKAAQSLQILISSISSDLLAEVVISNMWHLPPRGEEEEELVSNGGNLPILGSINQVGDVFSFSRAYPLIASLLNAQPAISHNDAELHPVDEENVGMAVDSGFMSIIVSDSIATMPTSVPTTVNPNLPEIEKVSLAASLFEDNVPKPDSEIPGLDSTSSFDEVQESPEASHTSVDLQVTSKEQASSLSGMMSIENSSSVCTTRYSSENLGVRETTADAGEAPSATCHVISAQYFLSKMVIPDATLTDEEKDNLQKVAFIRIIEAYKQIEVSGSSSVRFSLLAHLGIEFPLELDTWGLLQKHALSDYVNHEGRELTLRVLYRLYRETEQDQDFLSSRTATSVYEMFLLTVAETLRDTFPASDKSLGRLLAEVPYLPDGVLKLLESLCSPENNEKNDKDFQSGDRVTQGLSIVWSLILLRPSNRDRCLHIALQSAIHQMEEVRMKAIRLVANKLFPLPSISNKIEDFANEKLHSVIQDTEVDAGGPVTLCKDTDVEATFTGVQPSSLANCELVSSSMASSSFPILEAQRSMSLYFALCIKKHSLLQQIFAIYGRIPKAAKQAVHRHIPILVRTIGSPPELLGIISDLPTGSEALLMQVLQTLTDGAVPSQDLILSVRKLYNLKLKDVEILIPILAFLPKDEVLPIIPQLVNLPMDKFRVALGRILQGSSHAGPSLTPAEVLIAIHGIDPEKDMIPLKKVMDACSVCFEMREVFTQQVLAKVLNQLVVQTPLPLLFMRTVIQSIGAFPALVDFVMEILSRLVNKQIWKYPKLWVGFLKCAVQTKPQSFDVLLKLPAAQLENALNKNPVLKSPLTEHANLPNIRSTLPRSTLVVLGLVHDSQTSGKTQTSQSQAADVSSSTTDVATEVMQESTALS